MNIDVVLLPVYLIPGQLVGRAVAVFDVLRATTTMTAALSEGVPEIRIFESIESVREAAAQFGGSRLLCGEVKTVRPEGFDLGNSPGAFTAGAYAGKTLFMSTTNGTKAIIAAAEAAIRFTGSLVNATATAEALVESGRDVTLLCAGSSGRVSMEDMLGCGAVIDAIRAEGSEALLETDAARVAHQLFCGARTQLPELLSRTFGGRNITAAGLTPDIDFSARLDAMDAVGVVEGDPPIVRLWASKKD